MTPTIHRLHDPLWAIEVVTPSFSQDYVDELKHYVKPRDRRWNPDAKTWLFKPIAVDLVCLLLTKHFGGFQWAEDATTSTALVSVEAAYDVLCLTPAAPAELVRHVYKWHCKQSHPDAGGDLRHMQDVNQAYELIERSCA